MYAFIKDVPIGEDLYHKIRERLGSEPLEGLIVHLVIRRDDGTLRYVDVWESKAASDAAFSTRIHAATAAVFRETGFRPAGEPPREDITVVDVLFGKTS
jgi:hypothetical protein